MRPITRWLWDFLLYAGSDFCKIVYDNQVIIKSTCYES